MGFFVFTACMGFGFAQNPKGEPLSVAYRLTGDAKYAKWNKMVHDYAYSHFHDKENGKWFGYLHRDGSVAQTAKGNLFKGPFHLPRQEWYCMQLLAETIGAKQSREFFETIIQSI